MQTRIRKAHAKWMVAAFVMAFATFAEAQSSVSSAGKERTRRVVLVSIEDRQLAVIENGNVLAYFPVAVGAAVSPSPIGDFEIVRRVANPAYWHDEHRNSGGQRQSRGNAMDGAQRQGIWDSRNECAAVRRARQFARMHPAKKSRCGEVVRDVARGDLVQIRAQRDEQIAAVFGGAPDVVTQVALVAAGQ